MKIKLDTVITAVLVVCAVVTTALVVRRELVTPQAKIPAQADQKPILINNWQQVLTKGVRIGSAEAPVQILELADFECPACGSLHQTLKELRLRYPSQVALTFVHYPLKYHRFAQLAAQVAECAGNQGRFEAMHDILFEQQQQFGLKPWSEMAKEAGVTDAASFEICIHSKEPIPRISEGIQLGKALDVKGTPTLIVNGWKLGKPPSLEELDNMVKAILVGTNHVGEDQKRWTPNRVSGSNGWKVFTVTLATIGYEKWVPGSILTLTGQCVTSSLSSVVLPCFTSISLVEA